MVSCSTGCRRLARGGVSGSRASLRLRRLKAKSYLLFMSGYTSDVISHQGILEDGFNFIPTPFTTRAMAAKIREVLGGS